MNKKKLLIVAPYCSLPGELNFNRFLYLAFLMSKKYKVTLITSKFRHYDKFIRSEQEFSGLPFNICLLDEPGYKKNVSFSRVYSHWHFCRNFNKWLEKNHCFDLVYSAYPLIETNVILAKKKLKYNFKLIVDVQDVWPESISSFLPVVSKLPLSILPFTRKANKAYRSADGIIAVSKTYLERASAANKTTRKSSVYIGSDREAIYLIEPVELNEKLLKLVYIGTLSHSYDLKTVILEMSKFIGISELHILGGGPEEAYLKTIAPSNVTFYGFLEYSEMFSVLRACDVALNPIKSGASQSVTNKLSDYLCVGIPVLNSQENDEVDELLKSVDYENYSSGSRASFNHALKNLIDIKAELKFKPNLRFDRSTEYSKVINLVESVLDD